MAIFCERCRQVRAANIFLSPSWLATSCKLQEPNVRNTLVLRLEAHQTLQKQWFCVSRHSRHCKNSGLAHRGAPGVAKTHVWSISMRQTIVSATSGALGCANKLYLFVTKLQIASAACRLQVARCKLRAEVASCNLQPAHCKLQIAICKLHAATCRLQHAAFKLQAAHGNLHASGCSLQGTSCKLRNVSCKLQTASCKVASDRAVHFQCLLSISRQSMIWE